MLPELVMAVVVVASDSCVLEGAVHALDLAIGPGMTRLGQPVLDIAFCSQAYAKAWTR